MKHKPVGTFKNAMRLNPAALSIFNPMSEANQKLVADLLGRIEKEASGEETERDRFVKAGAVIVTAVLIQCGREVDEGTAGRVVCGLDEVATQLGMV